MTCAIILAAGNSLRMGTQKLLLPVSGQPAIARIAEVVTSCPAIADTIVVTGRDGPAVREALLDRAVRFAENPDRAGDMLSSVRCGLRALPDICTGVLVVLGDQPGITPDLVAALLAEAKLHRASIIVPVADGRRGHPLFFSAHYRDEVLEGFDGTGLRALLAAHPESVREVPVPGDPTVLADMDTPTDYERLKRFVE